MSKHGENVTLKWEGGGVERGCPRKGGSVVTTLVVEGVRAERQLTLGGGCCCNCQLNGVARAFAICCCRKVLEGYSAIEVLWEKGYFGSY